MRRCTDGNNTVKVMYLSLVQCWDSRNPLLKRLVGIIGNFEASQERPMHQGLSGPRFHGTAEATQKRTRLSTQ